MLNKLLISLKTLAFHFVYSNFSANEQSISFLQFIFHLNKQL